MSTLNELAEELMEEPTDAVPEEKEAPRKRGRPKKVEGVEVLARRNFFDYIDGKPTKVMKGAVVTISAEKAKFLMRKGVVTKE